MTQYVGVIRKDMSAFMTPQGVQLQQNLDAKKTPEMTPHDFGLVGVDGQNRYFNSDKYEPATESGGVLLYDAENNPTSRVPETMAMRQAYDKASKRGVRAQKIGRGFGGAVGVMTGLVNLANAGAAGQDAVTGGVNAFQTGQYATDYIQPRLGNFAGRVAASTAAPVRVTRQKTFDPVTASPTNTPATPAATPATPPVAVASPQNLPTDKRKVLGVDNYEGAQNIQQEAMSMLGNPHYDAGAFSAVNTTDDQGRTVGMPGAGPAQNTYDATAIAPDPNRMTNMGKFPVQDKEGRPVHPPALQQQVAVAEPTVPPTPSASNVGQTLLTQGFGVAPPNPSEPTDAEETIESSKKTGQTISDAIKMEKAEILGRQAAYDDFVKMFVEVKS